MKKRRAFYVVYSRVKNKHPNWTKSKIINTTLYCMREMKCMNLMHRLRKKADDYCREPVDISEECESIIQDMEAVFYNRQFTLYITEITSDGPVAYGSYNGSGPRAFRRIYVPKGRSLSRLTEQYEEFLKSQGFDKVESKYQESLHDNVYSLTVYW